MTEIEVLMQGEARLLREFQGVLERAGLPAHLLPPAPGHAGST